MSIFPLSLALRARTATGIRLSSGHLFVYCYLASVLPVWLLLQPRDLVNSHQLLVAMVLLISGLVLAGWSGQADLLKASDAVATNVPKDALPIFPFLFITIACGACSGFHCLVSSGTSSKQVSNEKDARLVGYGSMLLESALAVVVIMACTAGVGMGVLEASSATPSLAASSSTSSIDSDRSLAMNPTVSLRYEHRRNADGTPVTGRQAWESYYRIGMTAPAGKADH